MMTQYFMSEQIQNMSINTNSVYLMKKILWSIGYNKNHYKTKHAVNLPEKSPKKIYTVFLQNTKYTYHKYYIKLSHNQLS